MSGDVKSKAEWMYGTTLNGMKYHKVWKQNQETFREIGDLAEWGDVVSLPCRAAKGHVAHVSSFMPLRALTALPTSLDRIPMFVVLSMQPES